MKLTVASSGQPNCVLVLQPDETRGQTATGQRLDYLQLCGPIGANTTEFAGADQPVKPLFDDLVELGDRQLAGPVDLIGGGKEDVVSQSTSSVQRCCHWDRLTVDRPARRWRRCYVAAASAFACWEKNEAPVGTSGNSIS